MLNKLNGINWLFDNRFRNIRKMIYKNLNKHDITLLLIAGYVKVKLTLEFSYYAVKNGQQQRFYGGNHGRKHRHFDLFNTSRGYSGSQNALPHKAQTHNVQRGACRPLVRQPHARSDTGAT